MCLHAGVANLNLPAAAEALNVTAPDITFPTFNDTDGGASGSDVINIDSDAVRTVVVAITYRSVQTQFPSTCTHISAPASLPLF